MINDDTNVTLETSMKGKDHLTKSFFQFTQGGLPIETVTTLYGHILKLFCRLTKETSSWIRIGIIINDREAFLSLDSYIIQTCQLLLRKKSLGSSNLMLLALEPTI